MASIGEVVQIHCTGRLDDGSEFQNSRRAGEPLQVMVGSNTLLPKVEQQLLDMNPGDVRTIRLAPAEAYGDYDPSLVQSVPANLIPHAQELPVGGFVGLRTAAGPLRAKVVSVCNDQVVLDCNHELAGQTVTFDLEMLSFVRDSAVHREMHPAGCACGCDVLKQQLSG